MISTMNNLRKPLCMLWLFLTLSCGGGSSEQSSGDKPPDSVPTATDDTNTPIAEIGMHMADEYIQAKIAASKKVLEKQLREGANIYNEVTDIPKDAFGMDELQAVSFNLSNFLWNKGYRDIRNEVFARRIKEIFGMTLPTDSGVHFLYVNLLEADCIGKPIYHRNNGIDYNGFFIVMPENFITDFYYLPEIIDYRSEYADLADMEKELPAAYWSSTYKAEVGVEKWIDLENRTDEYNLDRQRKFNRLLVLNRNRFLFENDNTRLSWLLEHDRFFMESLVKRFGWTAHEDLLYEVVRKTPFVKAYPDDFGRLFWRQDCQGSVKVYANTFQLLQKHYRPDATSEIRGLLSDIQAYLEYMMGYSADKPHLTITDEQRIEILANMVYFAEQYKFKKKDNGQSWSDHRMMGRFRLMLNESQQKVLADNGYFGLPKFKEWWDAADYDEYYVDGEYNGPWGRDNEPMTESEWRASSSS